MGERMYPEVFEFLAAKTFGWTLEYIRDLKEKDYSQIECCLETMCRIDGEFKKLKYNIK